MANLIPVAEHSHRLAAEMRQTTEAWKSLASPLSAAQLAWTPPAGGWSVGQVLEHLVVVDGLYLQLCEALVARGTPATDATWKPTLMGGLLARSVAPESKTRLPAPKAFRPGPAARVNALDTFVAMRERLATLVERAAPLDWRRLKGPSPITPLVRLNLGDVFQVLVNHANRHLGQAHRIVAHESFPRRAGA
jgi:hypothetical protein